MPVEVGRLSSAEAAAAALQREQAKAEGDDTTIGRAWAMLGQRLRADGERATWVGDDEVDAVTCFARALERLPPGPERATLWRDMADALEDAVCAPSGGGEDSQDEEDGEAPQAPPRASVECVGGLPHTALACRCRAVESDPTCAEQWVLLAQAIDTQSDARRASAIVVSETAGDESLERQARDVERHAKDRAAAHLPDAASRAADAPPLSSLDCFCAALDRDVGLTDAWFFVADMLTAAENKAREAPGTRKAKVVGKQFAAWQCLVEGLKRDPRGYASGWADLARAMPPEKESVVVGNSAGSFTRLQCVVQSLAIDDADAHSWMVLGMLLQAGPEGKLKTTCIQHEGKKYYARDCIVRALELDPELCEAWISLAAQLRGDGKGSRGAEAETVEVAGEPVAPLQCYAAALRLDGRLAMAWHGLGVELDALGGSATDVAVDDEVIEVTPLECVKRAVTLDERDGTAWHDLARLMPTGGTVEVNGWQRSQVDCFAEACALEPNDYDCWVDLAEALPRGGVVRVGDRVVGALRCYSEAVRCRPTSAAAWSNVGAHLMPLATVAIADQLGGLTQLDCYVRSLRIDPQNPVVWRNLASALLAAADAYANPPPPQEGEEAAAAPASEPGPPPPTSLDVLGDGVMLDAAACEARAQQLQNEPRSG